MAQPAAGNGAHPDPMSAKPVPFVHVYFAFAAGYLLSYLLRTVNAVISPELTRDLGLSSSALGLLTSAYFIAFGVMQIPAGMLLDRYGPRRVEPALLLFCGIGTLAFALADGVTGLIVARALIGAGRVGLPDGAAEGDLRVVSGRSPGVVRELDHGRRRHRGAGGDHPGRARAAGHGLARRVRRAVGVRGRHCRVDLVARARYRTARDRRRLRRAVGRSEVGVREPSLLVARAAGLAGHGVVHGDPGPVVGAVADGGERIRSRRCGGAPPADERGDARRLPDTGPLLHPARPAGHSSGAAVRRRLRGQFRRAGGDPVGAFREAGSGGRCTVWARR